MQEIITAYKWLTAERKGSYGHGDYRGYLPRPSRPGKWTPAVTPRQCAKGWHVTDVEHLWSHWTIDGTLYVAECRGESSVATDKTAWESIRLLRPVGVLTREIAAAFACEVAERVLPIFEQRLPGDDRPRKAIAAARRGDAAYAAAAYAAAPAAATDAATYAAAAAYAAYAAAYAAPAAGQVLRRWAGERLLALLAGA